MLSGQNLYETKNICAHKIKVYTLTALIEEKKKQVF